MDAGDLNLVFGLQIRIGYEVEESMRKNYEWAFTMDENELLDYRLGLA